MPDNAKTLLRFGLYIAAFALLTIGAAGCREVPAAEPQVAPPPALLPFPGNRVRDFYARQAQQVLAQPRPWPELLPEFPGLDGGSFGHWGQNPEADNYDDALNQVDLGGLLAQVTRHFGRTTFKAVNFRCGDAGQYSALFDPETFSYRDVWRDGFVQWQSVRFGITSGVDAVGSPISAARDIGWTFPAGLPKRYLGFFRSGPQVVFHYQLGPARVYDRLVVRGDSVRRELTIDGELPAGVELTSKQNATVDAGETRELAHRAEPRWSAEVVETAGELGSDTGPYAIDTLTIPYGQQNPFGTPMRLGGLDFLPDGRIAICTLVGDVWLVDGVDDQLRRLRWRRIAAGLNQPLGLVVQDGKILVIGRDQLTRLHDLNGDDEADWYECVTNQFPTAGGDGFATALEQDLQRRLYWFTYSGNFGVTRLDPAAVSGPEVIATGLRGTNGMGVSPDGQIVLASAQEGTWTPASAIFEVGGGSYHGFFGPRPGHGKYGYRLPLCFIPRGVDNSCGSLAFLPDDARLGPLAGQMVGTSFGYCQHYLVLRETIDGQSQGGVVPLPGEFLSGAHRLRFSPRDGHLYVAGTDGWQSYARANGSLQRLRYTGRPWPLPTRVETKANGLVIHFNTPIDPSSVGVDRVFCEQWNYLYSAGYGSPEYSLKQPGRRGHDLVDVRSIHLLDDGKSVFVEIPQLHPVMQFHAYLQMATRAGEPLVADIYYSIFHQAEEFTSFPHYQPVAKTRYPDFPTAANYPRDPRLTAQENLGKEFSILQGVVSLQIDAVAGLRYEPAVLRVPPGKRVALVLRNADPGMSHNWVLVQPDRLESIAQQAMLLAADPQAFAHHYVPHDEGVIALSPILNPQDQYSVYFDSPKQRGAYPFLCTFPGHSQVMRGVLYVLNDDEPLPASSPFAPPRQFVRMWMLDDLTADAERLTGRSFERGQRTFQTAGCAQCHKVGEQGATLGPELTSIQSRFQGAKLLQQILDPSSEINKQYQTFVIYRHDGTSISGLVVAEDEQTISVVANPLLPEQVTRIARADIDELEPSPVSTMPKGLLMTLQRDEILDLLAYLTSGGNPNHAVFGRP